MLRLVTVMAVVLILIFVPDFPIINILAPGWKYQTIQVVTQQSWNLISNGNIEVFPIGRVLTDPVKGLRWIQMMTAQYL